MNLSPGIYSLNSSLSLICSARVSHPRASAGVSTGTPAQVQPAHGRSSGHLPLHATRAGETVIPHLLRPTYYESHVFTTTTATTSTTTAKKPRARLGQPLQLCCRKRGRRQAKFAVGLVHCRLAIGFSPPSLPCVLAASPSPVQRCYSPFSVRLVISKFDKLHPSLPLVLSPLLLPCSRTVGTRGSQGEEEGRAERRWKGCR